jgi:hypothetical protein
MTGKIECKRRDTSDTTLQSSFSDIFLTLDSRTLESIFDFVNSFAAQQSCNFLPNPVYNDVRLTAAVSLIQNVKRPSFQDLRLDFHGLQIHLREQYSDGSNDDFRVNILRVEVRGGDFWNYSEAKQLDDDLIVCRKNMVRTFQLLEGKKYEINLILYTLCKSHIL